MSARWLAPRNPKTLAILGAGHQALAHMQVLLDQYSQSLRKIKLWNWRVSSAIKLAEDVSGWLKPHQTIEVCKEVEGCVTDADIIATTTFTQKPVMKAKGLKTENCHIMAVGAPRPNWAEIEPEVWNASRVYVDSFAGAKAEAGDLIFSQCPIENELGTFISQGNELKTNQRTAFKSLGLAIEDLVAAKMTFENCKVSSDWPIKFESADAIGQKKVTGKVMEKKVEVEAEVTNLKCNAFLLCNELMICEMKTSSESLALLYKAKTGELKAILDISKVENDFKTDLYGQYII